MGIKGNEHNNLMVTLTPTVKISLKRVFNLFVENCLSVEAGFRAYDCLTGRMEQVIVKLLKTKQNNYKQRLRFLYVVCLLIWQPKVNKTDLFIIQSMILYRRGVCLQGA